MRLNAGDAEKTFYSLLDQYVEAGGTFLDSANIYGGGISESLLGRWMKERRKRSRLFIATKIGFGYSGVDMGLQRHQIETECEKSLKRLGIETIDLYYAHVDDRETPMEETLEVFDQLVRAGKVRFIGASNFQAWRLDEAHWLSQAHGWAQYCCIQQRYSYVRPNPGGSFGFQIVVNEDLLDYCRTRSTTLLAYSPLLSGAYTRLDRSFPKQYLGPDTDARVAALKSVADEIGATANQVIYAWMMQSQPYVIPLLAASTPKQMQENLGALDIKLSTKHMARLNSAGSS